MQLELEPKFIESLLNYLALQKWGEVQAFMPVLLQQLEEAQQRGQNGQGDAPGGTVVPMHQPAN